MALRTVLVASLLATLGASREIPTNVKNFYNSVKKGTCKNVLASGFYSSDEGGPNYNYCGDHVKDYNIIYLQGKGELVDMDIDCDGIQKGPADDGRCGSSGDTQSITSFQYLVEGYKTGQKDLDANAHSYIVFGNEGTKPKWATFDPEKHGIKPLSVMAVVCNNKMFYGVWGDENGDDGTHPMVGEASISLATACFGKSMNGNNGHSENDVLYIAFPGADAVPGAKGAKWNAQNFKDFEASLATIGDKLVKRIGASGGNNGGGSGGGSKSCSKKKSLKLNQ
ncbi:hypothetical protein FDECE_7560 [Fusarium decemcellulare]|nr:hypothetical protein FDECE_7560 [Fusarium decemcellulare]